jgi:alkanesulfonate monooxygenase SsuD/methylene tetrahydromethanopterin reductase-like flavin-dependent oxidoreductase (luciferase family)
MGLRFGIGVPNVGEFADPKLIAELAVLTERSGWDGIFMWDHLLYRDNWPAIDAWIALAGVASRTGRLRFGLMVAALPRQLPWEVAKRALTLHELSDGRFLLGAGLGSMPEEYTSFGSEADARVRAERLDEALEVITRLWREESVTYEGRHFRLKQAAVRPRLHKEERIPIWIGGRWPNQPPFRRAARWDGLFATHSSYGKGETMPPEELAAAVQFAYSYREPTAPPLDVAVEGASPTDPALAWDRVAPYLEAGLTWWIEALGWWRGDVDEARRRVAAGPPREAMRADGGAPGPGSRRG